MLRFSDFSHLPEVDELVRQLIAEPAGLVVVAGLDGRPAAPDDTPEAQPLPFLPSGRATILRILAGELLDAYPKTRCLVVGEDRDLLHVARRFRNRIEQVHIKPPLTYANALAAAQPGLLVVDRITPDNYGPVLAAARGGARVLSQLDTIYHAQAVAHYLAGLCAPDSDLSALRWVLSVQRLPTLCPVCKRPAEVTAGQLAQLEALDHRFGSVGARHVPQDGGTFYAAAGCPTCNFTGRQGDVAVFDFLRLDETAVDPWARPSALSMEVYIWMLAQRGQLALADTLDFPAHQLRRTYGLLSGTERRLSETTATLERKTAELDGANRLLNQRTRELVSLEGIGQALITWNDLRELGDRVLKTAMELSKADRGILYYGRSAEWGQILASRGWPPAQDEMGLSRALIYENLSDREPLAYVGTPPGLTIPADSPPVRAGQAIPLVAHGIPAGLMVIQSTRKAKFSPGETALLTTLAGYAAMAMQRAGLIEQLRIKINALEEAQEELAGRERLERELELARQVQLSMLPRTFPAAAGLTFAAAYAPARHVGGDFYDAIRLDDDRIAVVIADVADKGMPAALYMAQTRSLILAVARHSQTPAAVLQDVNRLLLEVGEADMFVTVFYGVLDMRLGRLTYTRAGHDHPFLVRDGRLEPLGGRGMALGLFAGKVFNLSQETVEVRSGDRLVLYTDGLTDVVGPGDEMLGYQRWVEAVLRRSSLPPVEMCRALFDDLTAYRQGVAQFDDMALMVVGVD
ncbi:MAG: SpoIIE family protein phosphatase [Candidatus Promineofilum sp.]|nr:SpoIIE family protein phosphatase [Promineifilum sp.]